MGSSSCCPEMAKVERAKDMPTFELF